MIRRVNYVILNKSIVEQNLGLCFKREGDMVDGFVSSGAYALEERMIGLTSQFNFLCACFSVYEAGFFKK